MGAHGPHFEACRVGPQWDISPTLQLSHGDVVGVVAVWVLRVGGPESFPNQLTWMGSIVET